MSSQETDRQLENYIGELYEQIGDKSKYGNLVSWLDNYANLLAGKQNMADRGYEAMFGREAMNLPNKLINIFQKAQVAGNLSSALNQTAQLSQIVAELPARDVVSAIRDMSGGALKSAIQKDGGWKSWAESSDFLTGKKGIDYLVNSPGEMVVSGLFKPAEFMDGMMSTLAVRGKYNQAIRQGMSEADAMKAADQFGKAIMGSRMKGSAPLAFQSKNFINKMVNVFQIEALNTWEHIGQDLPAEFQQIAEEKGKSAAAMSVAVVAVKSLLAAFLLNRLDEEVYGGTPAPFDLLGMAANFVASGNGVTTNRWLATIIDNGLEQLGHERLFGTEELEDREFDWTAAVDDTKYNISNEVPFLSNVSGIMGWGDQTLPLPDVPGMLESAGDLAGRAWNSLPFVHGDEETDEDGEPIGNAGLLSWESLEDLASILGQMIPGGRQLTKSVSGGRTLAQGGRTTGYGDNERLQYPVEATPGNILQALAFGNNGLSESRDFWASDSKSLSAKQTRVYQGLVEDGADGQIVYDAIQGYRAIDNNSELTSYERGEQERDLIRALDLTDRQKLELYKGLSGADGRAEKFRVLLDNGMTWDQVMDAYDKYAELNAEENMKASEQATSFALWLDKQKLSSKQKELVKDSLKFYSQIPAEAERYEGFTAAGLDEEDAYRLTLDISELEPEEGKEQVSALQRAAVITESGLSVEDQLAALEGVLSESEYQKVQAGQSHGVEPGQYVQVRQALREQLGEKTPSQDEVEAVLDRMLGLSRNQKAVLWQLMNKSWKSKNNPYSSSVGGAVYDALNEEKLPSLTLPGL